MENIAQLRQSAIEKLNILPEEKLIEVLTFIDFITTYPHKSETQSESLPPPDAFLEYAGTWEFEPGELDEILHDIEQSRLMELEEQYNGLLD
jgi:hypothetical protein